MMPLSSFSGFFFPDLWEFWGEVGPVSETREIPVVRCPPFFLPPHHDKIIHRFCPGGGEKPTRPFFAEKKDVEISEERRKEEEQ